jgi:hypothetical protein
MIVSREFPGIMDEQCLVLFRTVAVLEKRVEYINKDLKNI